jgi:hypothetical protein
VFTYSLQDIETFDLEDFKYNFVNMTAFRIVDAEDVGVREILRDMERFQPVGHSILNKSRIIQVSLTASTVLIATAPSVKHTRRQTLCQFMERFTPRRAHLSTT